MSLCARRRARVPAAAVGTSHDIIVNNITSIVSGGFWHRLAGFASLVCGPACLSALNNEVQCGRAPALRLS